MSRYHTTRYVAGGLYGLAAVFGAMSAYQTVRTLRTSVAVTPTPNGATVSLAGRF